MTLAGYYHIKVLYNGLRLTNMQSGKENSQWIIVLPNPDAGVQLNQQYRVPLVAFQRNRVFGPMTSAGCTYVPFMKS